MENSSDCYDNGFFNGYTHGWTDGQKAMREQYESILENHKRIEYKKGYKDGRLSVLKTIPTLMDELQKAYEEGQYDS